MTTLITEAEFAERLQLPVEKVAEKRRAKKWPHVRVTRFEVRYTEAQVEQIIASLEVGEAPAKVVRGAFGQTAASAGRSR
jgi:hypothetical protein